MQVLFLIWGGLGFLFNLINLIPLVHPEDLILAPLAPVTPTYASAIALIWIGGMLFFALALILYRTHPLTRQLEREERAEAAKRHTSLASLPFTPNFL